MSGESSFSELVDPLRLELFTEVFLEPSDFDDFFPLSPSFCDDVFFCLSALSLEELRENSAVASLLLDEWGLDSNLNLPSPSLEGLEAEDEECLSRELLRCLSEELCRCVSEEL